MTRTTDADGEFDFGAVRGTTAEFEVSSPFYAWWHQTVPLPTKDAALIVTLDSGKPVTVTVVDTGGTPVPGASLMALDRQGTTGPDGKAILPHMPDTAFLVEAYSDSSPTHRGRDGSQGSAQRAAGSPTVTVKIAAVELGRAR